MQRVIVYAIMADQDRTEGRGGLYFTGLTFDTKACATKFVQSDLYAQKWGVMGTHGGEYNIREMTITMYNSYEEARKKFPEYENAQRRQKALDKLTQEDREALGLN